MRESTLTKGLSRSRSIISVAKSDAAVLASKGFGVDNVTPAAANSQFAGFGERATNRRRYSLFRGWVHAAVNAIAECAAGQPVNLGQRKQLKKGKKAPGNRKITSLRTKAAKDEMEIVTDHGILDLLEKPNPIQYRWQYTYSFIANLCLTGYGYLVAGESEDGMPEVYSLPTTWVKPVHKDGPFSHFKIADPNNSQSEASDDELLDQSQVRFAYLPDPSNPLAAIAPASSQSAAIKIDDHIQTSQMAFFENGIFPSVVVTIGKNPHPELAGTAIRPRLTGKQRRQIYAAIKKVQAGTSNYGNPAIVDGLIESIDRVSASQNEMGWEKSEKTVRGRILSAFGVHPFVLGEEIPGSEAQARIIKEKFYDKVNTFLDLLSTITTDFVPGLFENAEDGYKIWYEPKVAINPVEESAKWKAARSAGDVSQNEYREYMGLPPDEDSNQSHIGQSIAAQAVTIAEKVSAGALQPEQGVALLQGMGLPSDLADAVAGEGPPEGEEAPPGVPGEPQVDEEGNPIQNELEAPAAPEELSDEDVEGQLAEAVKLLRVTVGA